MMFFGPNAASPPKKTFGLDERKVISLTTGMPHSSKSMPMSRSIQGNAFSWPTATSTSSHSKVWSGSPALTSLRRPLASYSAFTFSNTMPVSLPSLCRNSFGTRKLWIGMPSRAASSFSHGEAFISSKPERTITFTSVAAEAARGAAAIHGGVAAAEHDHALADLVGVAERDVGEPVDADMDVGGGFLAAGNVEVAAARRAGADEDRVEALAEQLLHAVDVLAAAELDAEVEDVAALLVDHAVGQAELRNLRADHAAGALVAVEHDAFIAERREVARDRERGGAGADQRDALAVLRCRRLAAAAP